MGTDRLHRLRRTTHPHRAAAQALRRAPRLAQRRRVRRRDRRLRPAPRPRLHPARDLLRLAAARGRVGALVGGAAFILPGLLVILALAAFFLGSPPLWARGAAAGAGSGVAAVAVQASLSLAPDSRKRARSNLRWLLYAAAGAAAAATIGPWLVLVLLTCGLTEIAIQTLGGRLHTVMPILLAAAVPTGGLGALAWVAIKVGALSYGSGFVIIPLIQNDAVNHYHWMTNGQFLNAVALGQITPGPVVQTVAVVGYAAAGLGGGLLAALIAFTPSFAFVLVGGSRFQQLRDNRTAQSFLNGAGPAAIGAIFGSAIPLTRALTHDWQYALLAAALVCLLALRRGIVTSLLLLGALGAVLASSQRSLSTVSGSPPCWRR
jgi:chromate transporter